MSFSSRSRGPLAVSEGSDLAGSSSSVVQIPGIPGTFIGRSIYLHCMPTKHRKHSARENDAGTPGRPPPSCVDSSRHEKRLLCGNCAGDVCSNLPKSVSCLVASGALGRMQKQRQKGSKSDTHLCFLQSFQELEKKSPRKGPTPCLVYHFML